MRNADEDFTVYFMAGRFFGTSIAFGPALALHGGFSAGVFLGMGLAPMCGAHFAAALKR